MDGQDWVAYLSSSEDEETLDAMRRHERTGSPLGSESLVSHLESILGRALQPQKAGRKRKEIK